jgi:hypothetical protein
MRLTLFIRWPGRKSDHPCRETIRRATILLTPAAWNCSPLERFFYSRRRSAAAKLARPDVQRMRDRIRSVLTEAR